MKIKLPVTWEVYGMVEIEADNIEDAIRKFDENIDYIGLPLNGEYVDGSFDLSDREVEYLELFQK
jgi:hypothetical protein